MTAERPVHATAGAASALLTPLLTVVARARPDADTALISRAYAVAATVHADQWRKSGDPYITHPVAVAAILAETGADDQTVCAGLLHDAASARGYSHEALLGDFGARIAGLASGVADPETGEVSGDARVVMIKLADRLHNLRTAAPLPQATRAAKSRDTLDVLVPLAASLGLDAIGAELQELATQTLSHAPGRAAPTARVLATASALLPARTRSRWRDEWAGELAALPTRRRRIVFTLRTLAGIPRLAVTLRRPRQPHP